MTDEELTTKAKEYAEELKAQIESLKRDRPCLQCKHYNKDDTTCKKGKPQASIGCYKDFEAKE